MRWLLNVKQDSSGWLKGFIRTVHHGQSVGEEIIFKAFWQTDCYWNNSVFELHFFSLSAYNEMMRVHPERFDCARQQQCHQSAGGNKVLRISNDFHDVSEISLEKVRSITDHQFILLYWGRVCCVYVRVRVCAFAYVCDESDCSGCSLRCLTHNILRLSHWGTRASFCLSIKVSEALRWLN